MGVSIGELIDGKYEIKRLLGEGGMGAVYEGENTLIHRKVAIKVLHAGVASNDEAVTRFEREAQAAGRIGSDHIVEVLDLGTLDGGERYMVMEFLRGESLSERIATRGRLSAPEICDVALQLLDGLSAAHAAGIIHRDLKPDNVFLLTRAHGRSDFVKILDFGISKFSSAGTDFSMTRTGSVMGTPYYMAPEQARGAKNLDARLDVYAAGVILYQAATGRVPFDGDTFNELLIKIVTEDTPLVSAAAPELDSGLAAIIDKARQRDPAHRFANAREFGAAIQAWLDTSGGKPLGAGQLTARLFDPSGAVSPAVAQTAPFLAAAPAGLSATAAMADTGAHPALAATAAPIQAEKLPLGAQTNQAWANTAHAVAALVPPKRKWAPVAAVAGVILAAGLGLTLKLQSDAQGSAARAAAASEAAEQQLQSAQADAEQKLAAERARSAALAAQAEKDRAEMERVKVSVVKDKQEAERLEQERKQAEAAAAAERAKAAATARARAAAASPQRPASTSAAGRKFRTSL